MMLEKALSQGREKLLAPALFWYGFDLAAGTSWGLMELFCGAWFLCWLPQAARELARGSLWPRRRMVQLLWLLLGLYLGWDLWLGVRDGAWGLLWEKYRTVLPGAGVGGCLWLAGRKNPTVSGPVLRTLGWSGVAAGAAAVLNLTGIGLLPIYYGRRISLRLDYNVYSTVLLVALLCGSVWLLYRGRRVGAQGALFAWLAPLLVLSASRRSVLLLIPLAAVLFATAGGLCLSHGEGRRFLAALGASLVGACFVFAALGQFLVFQYDRLLQSGRGELLSPGEGSVFSRYETLTEEWGGSRRALIWELCWEQVQQGDTVERWTGQGFGADRLLYRQSRDPRLLSAYTWEERENLSAHGFLLADALNGGWVQVGLGAALWAGMAAAGWACLRRSWAQGLVLGGGLGLVLLNNLISNRFGFLSDRYFWVFAALLWLWSECPRQNDPFPRGTGVVQ